MNDLIPLLQALRDGSTDEAICAQARELVQAHESLPSDVRTEALTQDLPAEAAALLAVLGEQPFDLVQALEAEAGQVEVTLQDEWSQLGQSLAKAVAYEAGTIDLVDHVLMEATWDEALLPEALAQAAGAIDIASDVQAEIERQSMPSVLAPSETFVAAPANNLRWLPVVLALAAAAVLAVFNLPSSEGPEQFAFASATEIVINDLAYADEAFVTVFQGESDNAPLIIWVDDSEAM